MSIKQNESLKVTYEFFNGKTVGRSLKEVAVDMIKTENEDLVSRWYHSTTGTDLFTWADRRDNIIKQQLNFNGQVVEWNCLEGIKTGVVIEQDMENEANQTTISKETQKDEAKVNPSETIKFDQKPQTNSVDLALEILKYTEIEIKLLDQLIGNFKDPQNIESMNPEAFLNRFGLALKNYQKQDHGFWQNLRQRFRSIFTR